MLLFYVHRIDRIRYVETSTTDTNEPNQAFYAQNEPETWRRIFSSIKDNSA